MTDVEYSTPESFGTTDDELTWRAAVDVLSRAAQEKVAMAEGLRAALAAAHDAYQVAHAEAEALCDFALGFVLWLERGRPNDDAWISVLREKGWLNPTESERRSDIRQSQA